MFVLTRWENEPGRADTARERDVTATHARPHAGAKASAGCRAGCRCPGVVALAVDRRRAAGRRSPAAARGAGSAGAAESQRADAQAAKDAAAAAFYELDTAQRDLRISIETITAVDSSPGARRAVDGLRRARAADRRGQPSYITAVDAHDLDRDDLEASVAAQARTRADRRPRTSWSGSRGSSTGSPQGLGPLLDKAETQLARLAPAVERARQALLAASNALDAVRASGLRADDLAARLAALAPELTKLNQGAGRHGVPETLQRADRVVREAEAVRAEAERLPGARRRDRQAAGVAAHPRPGPHHPRGQVEPGPQRAAAPLHRGLLAGSPARPRPGRATTSGRPRRSSRRRGRRATSSAGRTRPPCWRRSGRC